MASGYSFCVQLGVAWRNPQALFRVGGYSSTTSTFHIHYTVDDGDSGNVIAAGVWDNVHGVYVFCVDIVLHLTPGSGLYTRNVIVTCLEISGSTGCTIVLLPPTIEPMGSFILPQVFVDGYEGSIDGFIGPAYYTGLPVIVSANTFISASSYHSNRIRFKSGSDVWDSKPFINFVDEYGSIIPPGDSVSLIEADKGTLGIKTINIQGGNEFNLDSEYAELDIHAKACAPAFFKFDRTGVGVGIGITKVGSDTFITQTPYRNIEVWFCIVGLTKYRIRELGLTWSEWLTDGVPISIFPYQRGYVVVAGRTPTLPEVSRSPFLITLSGGYGSKTIEMEAMNDFISVPIASSIVIEYVNIPSGTLVINHDEPVTSSLTVELNIDVLNATLMKFSNDGIYWSNWYPYADIFYPWALEAGGAGGRVVYGIFKSASGAEVEISDTIEYVAEPIVVSVVINQGDEYTISLDVILNMDVLNAEEMRFSNDNINWTAWEFYGSNPIRIKDWTLAPPEGGEGIRVVYANFRNGYGTASASDTIRYVIPIPVTGGFVINNDDETTLNKNVVLNVNVAGAYKMRFRNEIYGTWSNWYPIPASPFEGDVDWTLLDGYGVKRVYGEFASITSMINSAFISEDNLIPNLVTYDEISLIRIMPVYTEALAGDSVIDAAWTPSTSPGLIGYNLYRTLVPGTNYKKIASIYESGGIIPTSYRDLDVINGVTYYYVVTVLVGGGLESDISNEAFATPRRPETLLDKQVISFRGIPNNAKVFWTDGYIHSKTGIYKIKGNIKELPKISGSPFKTGGIEEHDEFTGPLEQEDEN